MIPDTEKSKEELIDELTSLRQELTEREADMHTSELRIASILEIANEAVISLDEKLHIILYNKGAERIFGYSEKEMMGQSLDILIPERFRDIHREHIASFNSSGTTARAMAERALIFGLRKSGEEFPAEASISKLELNGKVSFSIVLHDVTKRKKMEKNLQESEDRYRVFSELISDYAYALEVEKDGQVSSRWMTETTFQRLTGYDVTELDNANDIYHPEDKERAVQDFVQLLREGTALEGEYRIVTKEGEVRWLYMRRKVERDEQTQRVIRVYGVAQDITEKKQMEVALRESEGRHRKIVNMISDVAFTQQIRPNNEDIYIWTSEQDLKDLTGYSAEEFTGFDIYHPEDRQAAEEDYQRILAGEAFNNHEYRMVRKDGEVRWVRVYRQAQWDEEKQEVIGIYGAVSDITENKNTEQRRLQLILEQERVKILEDFITQASHEFKTPLSIIKTSTYLLSRLDATWDQQRHITNIDEHVDYIATLVANMITMSSLASHAKIKRSRIDLHHLIYSIHGRLQDSHEKKNLSIQLELEDGPLWFQGDSEIMTQAIGHIYENAILFSDLGDTISVHTQQEADTIIIEISDTGIGIRAKDLPHIFEPFYRVNKAGTLRGFGLGLAIAKRSIELHQGMLEVESIVGTGSTFRIILPINENI